MKVGAGVSVPRARAERGTRGLVRFRLLLLALGACGGGSDAPAVDAQSRCETQTHDEDGDGLVDVCDNCPTTANPDQRDTTEVARQLFEDGVGDACDRRPSLGGDMLGALFTWADVTQSAAWNGTGWTIDSDALRTTGDASWQSRRGEAGDGLIVAARLESLAWNGASDGAITVALDGDGVSSGVACTLRQAAGGGEELVATEVGGTSQTIAITPPDDPSAVRVLAAWRRVTIADDTLACRIEVEGTPSALRDITLPLTDDLTVGAYAVAATGATAAISSVIVYTSPGPKDP